jgi:hypothetical protein
MEELQPVFLITLPILFTHLRSPRFALKVLMGPLALQGWAPFTGPSWMILANAGPSKSPTLTTYHPVHYACCRPSTTANRGTYSVNFGDQVVFVWQHGRFKATMPLTSVTNVGLLRSAPGHRVFSSFLQLSDVTHPTNFSFTLVTDDEADTLESDTTDDATLSSTHSFEGEGEDINASSTPSTFQTDDDASPPTNVPATDSAPAENSTDSTNRPAVIPFDLDHEDPKTNIASHDDATSTLDSQAELLRWHYRLGHLPFANICLMATKGEIPRRVATCRVPRCQSCLYGRATKRPWRTKAQPNKIRAVTRPGQCVLVDQLESPVPGLKGQNKGFFFRE